MRPLSFTLATTVLLATFVTTSPAAAEPHPAEPAPSPTIAGTTDEELVAIEATLVGITEVAAGFGHSCARLANAQMRCWGDNDDGQLGVGDENPRSLAVTVKNAAGNGPLQNVIDIAVGDSHSCALLANREVRCWGQNIHGEVGDDTNDDRSLPVPVVSVNGIGRLANVNAISGASDGTCALLTNEEVRCWGDDDYGQLGNGAPEVPSSRPVKVAGLGGVGVLDDVRQLDAGYDNTCAALTNGQARCWGYNSGLPGVGGSLGDGTYIDSSHPTVVKNLTGGGPLTGITQVSASGYHSCARLANGQARCWGMNGTGLLGNGMVLDSNLPVVVKAVSGPGPLTGVRGITTGEAHTCAVLNTSQVRCWGKNTFGQLGIGTVSATQANRPRIVVGTTGPGRLTGATQIDTNKYHTCVRLGSGQARCWGLNSTKQLGNGNGINRGRPTVVRV